MGQRSSKDGGGETKKESEGLQPEGMTEAQVHDAAVADSMQATTGLQHLQPVGMTEDQAVETALNASMNMGSQGMADMTEAQVHDAAVADSMQATTGLQHLQPVGMTEDQAVETALNASMNTANVQAETGSQGLQLAGMTENLAFDTAVSAKWMFETRRGYQRFDISLEKVVEAAWQGWRAGNGPPSAQACLECTCDLLLCVGASTQITHVRMRGCTNRQASTATT